LKTDDPSQRWTWSDISDKITARTNRTLWAMTYADNSWFYTDGLDFASGGHVYRNYGSSWADITNTIKNAGLTRVDDIVSDGKNVVFLQSVVSRTNAFKAAAYRNYAYVNVTSALRGAFQSDEGLRSAVGRNGTWYLVTTKNRLLRWSGGADTPVAVALPSDADVAPDTTSSYRTNHTSIDANAEIGIVPVANGNWLLLARRAMKEHETYRYVGAYRFDGTTFMPMDFSARSVSFLTSNGTDAMFYAYDGGLCIYGGLMRTDGVTVTDIVGYQGYTNCGGPPNPVVLTDAIAAYDGSSWMIIQGKQLYRVVGSTLSSLGVTRDVFAAAASNGAGIVYLSGAASTSGSKTAILPLTAKLVKAVRL